MKPKQSPSLISRLRFDSATSVPYRLVRLTVLMTAAIVTNPFGQPSPWELTLVAASGPRSTRFQPVPVFAFRQRQARVGNPCYGRPVYLPPTVLSCAGLV